MLILYFLGHPEQHVKNVLLWSSRLLSILSINCWHVCRDEGKLEPIFLPSTLWSCFVLDFVNSWFPAGLDNFVTGATQDVCMLCINLGYCNDTVAVREVTCNNCEKERNSWSLQVAQKQGRGYQTCYRKESVLESVNALEMLLTTILTWTNMLAGTSFWKQPLQPSVLN